MQLTKEQIDEILGLLPVSKGGTRPNRKQIVIRTHYPQLPPGGQVKLTDKSVPCMSRRCSTPTHYKFRGISYCTTHLITALAHELELKNGSNATRNSD